MTDQRSAKVKAAGAFAGFIATVGARGKCATEKKARRERRLWYVCTKALQLTYQGCKSRARVDDFKSTGLVSQRKDPVNNVARIVCYEIKYGNPLAVLILTTCSLRHSVEGRPARSFTYCLLSKRVDCRLRSNW